MKDKKLRLEQSLYKWLDAVDEVQEEILKLLEKRNTPKSKIAFYIDNTKSKLRTLENNLKIY